MLWQECHHLANTLNSILLLQLFGTNYLTTFDLLELLDPFVLD